MLQLAGERAQWRESAYRLAVDLEVANDAEMLLRAAPATCARRLRHTSGSLPGG